MRRIFALILMLSVYGAANAYEVKSIPQNADEVAKEVKFEFDKFEKKSKYTGPTFIDGKYGNAFYHKIHLRAFSKAKLATAYQIYITTYYSDSNWMRYRDAFDDQGTRLSFTPIDYSVDTSEAFNRVYKVEDFALNVSKNYLERLAKRPSAEFKITGPGGSMIFELPGSYVEGFLQGMIDAKGTNTQKQAAAVVTTPTPVEDTNTTPMPAIVKHGGSINKKDCKPEYPTTAKRSEETGTVTLSFLIAPDGKVMQARVVRSSGFRDLDRAAMAGLSKCTFQPAIEDGKPTYTWVDVGHTFNLDEL